MEQNPQLQLAAEFMHSTNKNIFLTGKAGTGKTTFLRELKKTLKKRMAIVAPTGVAAINAGGVTIHSFFQLPFGPLIPESSSGNQRNHKFNRERINLIKSLDLLVIDEISMVRADLLDGIDEILRRYRNHSQPFGGIQLLMIGDLHQLAPVLKDNEWALLRPYYDSVFFFSSHALKKSNPVRIELTHIYRQSDHLFIGLLNKIRENQLDLATIETLNQRYIPDFKPDDAEGYISLTTHNTRAQAINTSKLEALESKLWTFEAQVTGDFPPYSFPTEPTLELKTGAQVMFVKNDVSRDKLFYNGKIGAITKITSEAIYVKCDGSYTEIEVKTAEWQNIKYVLNEQSKEVEEQIIGAFVQYPLKLAWAITIHKSQGLTFEKAIIDANASFAHGQVYVALSRCKSFEGMVLSSPIHTGSVKTDSIVTAYSRNADKNPPDGNVLLNAKSDFQRALILELFDYDEIKRPIFQLHRLLEEHASIVNPSLSAISRQLKETFTGEIATVSDKFTHQLHNLLREHPLPEQNEVLKDRIRKACHYFMDKMDTFLYPAAFTLQIDTDNAALKKSFLQISENLQKAVVIKKACLDASVLEFTTALYLQAKANADIDFKAAKTISKSTGTSKNMPHGPLYDALKAWRQDTASGLALADYMVLPMKTLLDLTVALPTSETALAKVKGVGKAKIKQFGKAIITLIKNYCDENEINTPEQAVQEEMFTRKAIKTTSRQTSYALYQEGKTLQEIAQIRGVSLDTIEGHLLSYIATGEVDIFKIYKKEHIQTVSQFLLEHQGLPLAQVKEILGEEISFAEIRAVQKYLQSTAF